MDKKSHKQTGSDARLLTKADLDVIFKRLASLDERIDAFWRSLKLQEEVLNESLRQDDDTDDRRFREIFNRLAALEQKSR